MFRTSGLERLIAAGYSEGFVRWGERGGDGLTDWRRIRNIILREMGASPLSSGATGFMKRLHCSDLYLATACAQLATELASPGKLEARSERSRLAWKVFSTEYAKFIGELARLFAGHDLASHKLTNELLAFFLLPDDSGTNPIARYDGRSSLYTWLRVEVRRACNRIEQARSAPEAKGTEGRSDQPIPGTVGQVPGANALGPAPAAMVLRAFRQLAPKERLLLLWRHKNRLSVEEIAGLLGMDEPRTLQFLERAHLKLANKLRSIAGDIHGKGAKDIDIEEYIRSIVE